MKWISMDSDFELGSIEKRDKIKIFMLGSNFPEDERRRKQDVCLELKNNRGFTDMFLMEDRYDESTHKYMDEAFKDFIHDSDIIVALLTKKGSKDGVGWEIGFMQGVDFLSEQFKVRKKLFLCLEREIENQPELTSMIKKGIIKKEGCKIVRFGDINELYDSLEGQLHAELLNKLENEAFS